MDVPKFTKKGMFVQTRLAYFILIILVGLILFNFVDEWKEKVEEENKIEKCKASVERNAKLKLGKLRLDEEIECPRRDITVKAGLREADAERAKEKIARELYICWRQFGRGRLDLFATEETYCKICSIITFEGQEVSGLVSYLIENDVPGYDMSYYEYLSSFHGGREGVLSPSDLESKKNEIIKDGKEIDFSQGYYYVVFSYVKGENEIADLRDQLLNKQQFYYAGGSCCCGVLDGIVNCYNCWSWHTSFSRGGSCGSLLGEYKCI